MKTTGIKIINVMKQVFLLALVSIMFVSCVNTNQEESQEEVILIEEFDSTSIDSTDVEVLEFLEADQNETQTEAQESEVTE